MTGAAGSGRSPGRVPGVHGPIDGPARLASEYPAVRAEPGLRVLHRASGFTGAVVTADRESVVLRGATGATRTFPNHPGAFACHGETVRLVPRPAPGGDAGTNSGSSVRSAARTDDRRGRVSTSRRTASGSRAVVGAAARVARASRILVEGVHDAELLERVWGDDLRVEGIVVERLDGVDGLADAVAAFGPGPGRRLGVLVDHLVPNSKEARLAAAVRHPHVAVRGTPYIDIWAAIRPRAVGIDRWPDVPRGVPWKEGVAAALGVRDSPGRLWRTVLSSVSSWTDLEQPLVKAVEELIDFVSSEG